jgi:hypothetical protein
MLASPKIIHNGIMAAGTIMTAPITRSERLP